MITLKEHLIRQKITKKKSSEEIIAEILKKYFRIFNKDNKGYNLSITVDGKLHDFNKKGIQIVSLIQPSINNNLAQELKTSNLNDYIYIEYSNKCFSYIKNDFSETLMTCEGSSGINLYVTKKIADNL